MRLAPVLLLSALALAGCRTPPPPAAPPPALSPEQRADMQTRTFADPVDRIFAATIAVLQDLGWSLDAADRSAGILRASTARRLEILGPLDEQAMDLARRAKTARERADAPHKWTRWQELVIHVEPWAGGGTRERIVMNLRGMLPARSYRERQGGGLFGGREVTINAPPDEQVVEVQVPEAYADLFERIDKAAASRRGP
jgi:hypothetical protein